MISCLCTEMLRPKCPQTEAAWPKGPTPIGLTESAWSKSRVPCASSCRFGGSSDAIGWCRFAWSAAGWKTPTAEETGAQSPIYQPVARGSVSSRLVWRKGQFVPGGATEAVLWCSQPFCINALWNLQCSCRQFSPKLGK